MKKNIICSLLLLAGMLASCDEGDIPAKQPVLDVSGRAAKVSVQLTGADNWPSSYTLAVAAFAEGNEYASYVKDISAASDGTGKLTCYNIPDGVKTLEVCAVNSLRKRMVSFASIDISEVTDTIEFNAGALNVGMYKTIQDNLFTTRCAACHGLGSGSPAAGLHLDEGNSYTSLVGQASTIVSDGVRVKAGDAAGSVLYQFLSTNVSNGMGVDHSVMLVSDGDLVKLRLVRDWINNGAKE